MSYDISEAERIILQNIPGGKVLKKTQHNNLFVFLVDTGFVEEAMMDPYYCVDKDTGEFREFSVFIDATPIEMVSIFNE